jgi:hypothetical protein
MCGMVCDGIGMRAGCPKFDTPLRARASDGASSISGFRNARVVVTVLSTFALHTWGAGLEVGGRELTVPLADHGLTLVWQRL